RLRDAARLTLAECKRREGGRVAVARRILGSEIALAPRTQREAAVVALARREIGDDRLGTRFVEDAGERAVRPQQDDAVVERHLREVLRDVRLDLGHAGGLLVRRVGGDAARGESRDADAEVVARLPRLETELEPGPRAVGALLIPHLVERALRGVAERLALADVLQRERDGVEDRLGGDRLDGLVVAVLAVEGNR